MNANVSNDIRPLVIRRLAVSITLPACLSDARESMADDIMRSIQPELQKEIERLVAKRLGGHDVFRDAKIDVRNYYQL